MSITHITGMYVQIGALLRQRCAWCGAVLCDYDLERIAVPVGQEASPATWPVGDLVRVDGNVTTVVKHEGGELPADACGRIDPEVTR